jgi:hypothetical protein
MNFLQLLTAIWHLRIFTYALNITMPQFFIISAVAFFSATLFVIGTCYIDQEVSLLLIFDIVFIFYKTLPVHCIYVLICLKELRHLINDIKLDTVLTINKSWTKTGRAVARGKI